MHELSIALSLVDVACEEIARQGDVRVDSIRLRLGPLAGVVKEALLFSFAAAASGTPLEGAKLHIDDVPPAVWCAACEAERSLANVAHRRCPVCDAATPHLLRGDELEMIGLEVTER